METEGGSQIALETYSRGSPPFRGHQLFPGGRPRENLNGGRHGSFSSRVYMDAPATIGREPLEHGPYNGNRMDWDIKAWGWDSVLFLAQPSPSSGGAPSERTKTSYHGLQNGNHDRYHPSASNGIGLTLDGSSISPDHNGSSDHDDLYSGQGRKHPLSDVDNGHPSYSDRAQPFLRDGSSPEEDAESLSLKLGGHSYAYSDDVGNGSRNAKRYRSASPGPQFPVCQVDDCKSELNNAKDYHRRHKVCEMHAKAGKALVSRLMQRFCQQCSRFHPLSEFDEGKRSCRRRLAGHNRRRRKSQPDPPTGRGLIGGEENGTGKAAGLVDFLNLFSSLQAVSTVGALNGFVSDQDAILQYLKKGALLPPAGLENLNAAAFANLLNMAGVVSEPGRPDLKPQSSTSNGHSQSTVAETEALLSALAAPKTTDALSLLLQTSLRGQLTSAIMKAAETPLAHIGPSNGNSPLPMASPGGRIPDKEFDHATNSASFLSPSMSGRPAGDHILGSSSRPNSIHHQAIAENLGHRTNQLQADLLRGHVTPLAMVQKLYPQSQAPECRSTVNGKFDVNRGDDGATESTSDLEAPASMMTFLEGQDPRTFHDFTSQHSRPSIDLQHPPAQYDMNENSPSGSDQSPSSSYADWQNRTGLISIKLFDRNPGELPHLLRTQIMEWLAHRPSDMESYIRPGCTVLTIFLSMPNLAWEELERDLRISLRKLTSNGEFWSEGRIHIQVQCRNAFIVDGNIYVSKPSKSLNSPRLLSVRPLAVVAGQRTDIVLRGCNLKHSAARIFCAYQGKYVAEIPLIDEQRVIATPQTGLAGDEAGYEELSISFDGGLPNVVGRAFIEVEVERQWSVGNALPVIVADGPVCAELQTLEREFERQHFDGEVRGDVLQLGSIAHQIDVKDFLNELGWLFQRSQVIPGVAELPKFLPSRQKNLLTFAVERDWCAVVKKLLDIVFGLVLASPDLTSAGIVEIFGDETSLLHIAAKRKCRPMVQLLLAYVPYSGAEDVDLDLLKGICKHGLQHRSIFTPDMCGPEGVTPLHIAASIEGAGGVIDALTSDPNQIGLQAWSSARNLKGESPLACALGRGNTAYVQLVRGKIARRDGQVTIGIPPAVNIGKSVSSISKVRQGTPLCSIELPSWAKVVPVENTGARKPIPYPSSCRHLPPTLRGYRGGSIYRPFLVSMVAIAAVCVCACLVTRSLPQVRKVLPFFLWGALSYGDS